MEWEELPGRKNACEHLQFQLKGTHDLLTSQRNRPSSSQEAHMSSEHEEHKTSPTITLELIRYVV